MTIKKFFKIKIKGGEICYPEYNIEHKPKAGDLVIHGCETIHAVKKVKHGKRYAHQGCIDELFWVDKDKYNLLHLPKRGERIKGDQLWT